jgi:adenylylsulfate kinase-like enzyme
MRPWRCAKRATRRGLYEKGRAGDLKGFTGIDAPYEAPDDPEIAVHTDEQTAAESVDRILAELLPRLRLSNGRVNLRFRRRIYRSDSVDTVLSS